MDRLYHRGCDGRVSVRRYHGTLHDPPDTTITCSVHGEIGVETTTDMPQDPCEVCGKVLTDYGAPCWPCEDREETQYVQLDWQTHNEVTTTKHQTYTCLPNDISIYVQVTPQNYLGVPDWRAYVKQQGHIKGGVRWEVTCHRITQSAEDGKQEAERFVNAVLALVREYGWLETAK